VNSKKSGERNIQGRCRRGRGGGEGERKVCRKEAGFMGHPGSPGLRGRRRKGSGARCT